MSDIFEMEENGILCSECGGYIHPPKGLIAKCEFCEDKKHKKKKIKKQ